ncbi:MAG: bifunctional DNA primase/polymerase [Acidobacteria bacterium]|nr:bifunctional DNA primase/polymerase [Acidobacteriota bacterium]
MPDKTKLDWALQYAEQGLHVFPVYFVLKDGGCSCHKGDCGRIGKHPATKNGVLDATTDPDQIRRWWAKNKNYNIGIATGHDGLVVIDADTGVDERDRRVKQGPENLAKLQAEHGTLPPTLQQRTGSGGVHYLFRSDKPIKNDNTGKVAQDVDVRGKSGYVVVPPSNHKSGGHYEWLNEGAPIAPMPEWLETLCPQEPVAPKVDASQDAAPSFDDKDLLKGATKDEVRKLPR